MFEKDTYNNGIDDIDTFSPMVPCTLFWFSWLMHWWK